MGRNRAAQTHPEHGHQQAKNCPGPQVLVGVRFSGLDREAFRFWLSPREKGAEAPGPDVHMNFPALAVPREVPHSSYQR